MRVLWLCNIMLPVIARNLHLNYSNKEGWLSGLADMVLACGEESGIELGIAFPAPEGVCDGRGRRMSCGGQSFLAFGFAEDTARPHRYDRGLEEKLGAIAREFQPDIVHCFGTEYPHTLAMCRAFPRKDRILVGIQGLCAVCAEVYLRGLPSEAVRAVTFRDLLKRDGLRRQQEKFRQRGVMEREAVRIAGNLTGRTDWDRIRTREWNKNACYYKMNENLRETFYQGVWREEECVPHTIFVSQGDYPIKGLHYLLRALPRIRQQYPDVHVFVAGDSVAGNQSFVGRWKLSAYGKFLRRLLAEESLEGSVTFLGRLNAEEMKRQYLKSHLFLCCSELENSPNSLGEAMILGVPCVSADVGGIPSLFTDGEDGILYRGDEKGPESPDRAGAAPEAGGEHLEETAGALAEAVIRIWSDPERMRAYCSHARERALKTHDREANYGRLLEIYRDITGAMNTEGDAPVQEIMQNDAK